MNNFGGNRPIFLKTYGRQKRKVEPWLSPDLRKQAFSFSSSLSSDKSITEHNDSVIKPKKRTRKSTAFTSSSKLTRPSKQKAMVALKEDDSDEENVFVSDNVPRNPVQRKKRKEKPLTKRETLRSLNAGDSETLGLPAKRGRRKALQVQTSDSEEDSVIKIVKMRSRKPKKTSKGKEADSGTTACPSAMGKFVTHRRRPLSVKPLKPQSSFLNAGIPNRTLNSSDDFAKRVPALPRCGVISRKLPERLANFSSEGSPLPAAANPREGSFNDSAERRLPCKPPLLSSTPSLLSRHPVRTLEPSISEISFSQDETEEPVPARTGSRDPRRPRPSEVAELPETSPGGAAEGDPNEWGGDGEETPSLLQEVQSRQTSVGARFVSAKTHLDSLIEAVKDRCRRENVMVSLEKIDSSSVLSQRSTKTKQETEEPFLSCMDSEPPSQSEDSLPVAIETCRRNQMSVVVRSVTSFLSSSSSSSSSCVAPSLSLEEKLKAECLSSCPAVALTPLHLPMLPRGLQERLGPEPSSKTKRDEESETSQFSFKVPRAEQSRSKSPPPPSFSTSGTRSTTEEDSEEVSPQNVRVKRRLSESFRPDLAASSPITAAPEKAPGSLQRKERAGTGRKARVSGLSVNRWTKRDDRNRNGNRRKNPSVRTKPIDSSLSELLSGRVHKQSKEPSWLQGADSSVLPVTPLRAEQLNLSSIISTFTPSTLTTHSWSRLKAALSIHKKKTALLTPGRLALSHLRSPAGAGQHNGSLDLFGSPACTPLSRLLTSRLLRTNSATPLTPYAEDISDAEKVYQECQQEGPLSFHDCIPPSQMKLCRKIGEGTFGEVFSVVNDAKETVALKIIPVEGKEKVNGEPQKTFGEILHEIIISKELSSLSGKEHSQTDGFIGLNNLHCVQGPYPELLLAAWDKFDHQRGSENDRPDFFGEDQLFLILEFEFGGTDLENMNGKLSSLAQAKSVLHQVTAALAVAEQALCFEHRDLHWGNILVKNTKQKECNYVMNGCQYSIDNRGIHVNVIDYSLSRLEIDGLTVSCDISEDEELFMGQGDYQFDIYRLMRKENNNHWSEYNPHSNVLWLHYLADKLLNMSYRSKAQSGQQRALKSRLTAFHSEILNYQSASDALQHCSLFQ